MKATDLKPGQAAIKDDGSAIALRNLLGAIVVIQLSGGPVETWATFPTAVPGNWDYLGPVTKLDDLPLWEAEVLRYEDGIAVRATIDAYQADDLQGRCLTRGEGEGDADGEHEDWAYLTPAEKVHAAVQIIGRCVNAASDGNSRDAYPLHAAPSMVKRHVNTLTARVAELEAERDVLDEQYKNRTSDWEYVKGIRDELQSTISHLKAELAALREQQTLGEPLTYRQWDELKPYTPVLIRTSNHELLPSFSDAIDWHEWKHKGATIYLDPRPLPVLPAPESIAPVPVVPAYQGVVTWTDEVIFVCRITSTSLQGCLLEGWTDTGCHLQVTARNSAIYTGPVRHPDGTIAPIEPSKELIAALSGEGANDVK